jgi:hypothetical protein
MDRWLDDLARGLAGVRSRRALLRTVGGGLATAQLASVLPEWLSRSAGTPEGDGRLYRG